MQKKQKRRANKKARKEVKDSLKSEYEMVGEVVEQDKHILNAMSILLTENE